MLIDMKTQSLYVFETNSMLETMFEGDTVAGEVGYMCTLRYNHDNREFVFFSNFIFIIGQMEKIIILSVFDLQQI